MMLKSFGYIAVTLALAQGVDAQQRKFKNVIMAIPDGCDDGVLGLARWVHHFSLSSGLPSPLSPNSLICLTMPTVQEPATQG